MSDAPAGRAVTDDMLAKVADSIPCTCDWPAGVTGAPHRSWCAYMTPLRDLRVILEAAAPHLNGAAHAPVGGVYTRPTEYQVSVFPDEMHDSGDMLTSSEAHTWSLTVAYRGCGKWAVTNGPGARQVLGTDGEWDWEPIPSSREDEWLATHRFSLDEALRLAREHAPKVTINGYTALDILAKLRRLAACPLEAPHA